MSFEPTHLLGYESGGRMVIKPVRKSHQELFTEEEWYAHSLSDWTFVGGEILYFGQPYCRGPKGPRRVWLRKIAEPPLPLAAVIEALRGGPRHADALAVGLGVDRAIIDRSLNKLLLARKVRRVGPRYRLDPLGF